MIRRLSPIVLVALFVAPGAFSQNNRSIHDFDVGRSEPRGSGLFAAGYFTSLAVGRNWIAHTLDLRRLNHYSETQPRLKVIVPEGRATVSYVAIAFITSLGAMFFASRGPKTPSEAA